MTKDIEKRFWKNVDIKSPEDCWEFKGHKDPCGYGQFRFFDKIIRSHRVAWKLHNGAEIPEGKLILHRCDNPPCCNPEHLYCGTRTDNMRDRCNRSNANNGTLYAEEIHLIRICKKPGFSCAVAKMFKVDSHTIRNIWKAEKYLCKEGYYV